MHGERFEIFQFCKRDRVFIDIRNCPTVAHCKFRTLEIVPNVASETEQNRIRCPSVLKSLPPVPYAYPYTYSLMIETAIGEGITTSVL